MYKKYLVLQNSKNNCASACLLSIMKYYNVNVSLDEITYILKTSYNGTSALNIINGSRTFGFDGYGIHYSYSEIINNNINLPIICHVKKNNMFHFIVVYEIKKNYLIVMDPSSKIMKITKNDFEKIYLNTSIVIYPVNIKYDKNKQISFLTYILKYIMIEKYNILKEIILSIIIIFLNILTNYYLFVSLDKVLQNYNYRYFLLITVFFMFNAIFKNIFEYIKNKLIIKSENNIFTKINVDIIRKLFNLPYLFFKNKSTSEIISRINDFKDIKNVISNYVMNYFINSIFIIISFILLFLINKKLLLINIIDIIIYLIILFIYKIIYKEKIMNVIIQEEEYTKSLSDNINSYLINKNLNLISNKNEKIENYFIKYMFKNNDLEYSYNKKQLLTNLVSDTIKIFIVFYGIVLIIENNISVSKLILFISLTNYFNEPFKQIIDMNLNIDYFKEIYSRIYDLLIMKEEKIVVNDTNIKGDIKISNLSYSYNGYDNFISNINIDIKYGSKFLIYGESGCGKSTLIKILVKYIQDYNGDIFINNINLKDINIYNISSSFNYVSQNNYISNDTLINNIIYGRNVSYEEYEKVINICNLNNLRNNNKYRNDMMILDNGYNISGGERQKIILARSLLKKADFYIFDEALSEVSTSEEKQIINKLINEYSDKTIIYITHKKEIINLFNNKYCIERRKGNDNK